MCVHVCMYVCMHAAKLSVNRAHRNDNVLLRTIADQRLNAQIGLIYASNSIRALNDVFTFNF
jgi:hypothetical protein